MTWFILDRVGLQLSELAEVDRALWVPNPLLLVAASLLLLGAYFMSASLWSLIVRDLGGPRLPAAEAIRIYMVANLGRYLPGKVWQLAGLATLARRKGVPAPTAAAAAVLGQGTSLVAGAAFGMGALLGGPESYRHWGLVGAALVVALMVLLAIPPVFASLAGAWFRLTRTQPVGDLSVLDGFRWLALYALNWVLYAVSFWVLARSLGLTGGLLPVGSAFAAAYVLGYAMIFAPAGLGPREGFLIVFLTPHLGAVPSGVLAVVGRLWTTVMELLPAAAIWLGWMRRPARAGAGSGIEAPEGADGRGGPDPGAAATVSRDGEDA